MDSKGDCEKLRKVLIRILPKGTSPNVMAEAQVEFKDWIPFENSTITLLENHLAPKMKNMPPMHRYKC